MPTDDTTMVAQKFSVSFFSNNDASKRQAKSGNPGYLNGYPLLIASPSTVVSGAKDTYENGFKLVGAD